MHTAPPIFYSYFRASAPYRVRIALALKNITYETVSVDLRQNDQHNLAYQRVNPQALVPSLHIDGQILTQSLAIIEWLEDCYPDPPLLPSSPHDRAFVRSLALTIACDIHPLNNLRVQRYLTQNFDAQPKACQSWQQHWIMLGLHSLETRLKDDLRRGDFCYGNSPGLVETCLIPQWRNAEIQGCDLGGLPILGGIVKRALALPAFIKAHPDLQPDYVPSP
jgi:maleylacetoacetate isomerase